MVLFERSHGRYAICYVAYVRANRKRYWVAGSKSTISAGATLNNALERKKNENAGRWMRRVSHASLYVPKIRNVACSVTACSPHMASNGVG